MGENRIILEALVSVFFRGKGLSPAATPCAAPHSPGRVPQAPLLPAPSRAGSRSLLRSFLASVRLSFPPVPAPRYRDEASRRRPVCDCAPALWLLVGGPVWTNRSPSGALPLRSRQGRPLVSLRCNLGITPPLTRSPRSRRGARFHAWEHDPVAITEEMREMKRWRRETDQEAVNSFPGGNFGVVHLERKGILADKILRLPSSTSAAFPNVHECAQPS